MYRRYPLLILSLALSLFSSCRTGEKINTLSTPTLYIITATLVPTVTLQPTHSPPPPSPLPTISPVKGITTMQVNVRSFPLISADVLGQLAIFTDVEITGKDSSGDWYRIKYSPVQAFTPGLPNNTGTGWVASEYVQVEGDVDVPVIPSTFSDQSVPPVLPSTQVYQTQILSGIPTPLTLPSVATEDGDTVQNPSINIDFSPTGAQSITYSSDVSSPQGDLEDWLKFRPYTQTNGPSSVSVIINCAGTNGVNIELQQVAQVLQTWENTPCKATARLILSLYGNAPYFFRIRPEFKNEGVNYVSYTITIQQDD